MAEQADARTHLAWLMWCYQEGYLTAEDRAVAGNWLLDDPSLDHPDDRAAREGLLGMADEVLNLLANPPSGLDPKAEPSGGSPA